TDSHAPITAVKTRRQIAIFRRIARNVRIEKKEVAASDLQTPDSGAKRAASRFDLNVDGLAAGANGELHRQLVDVGLEVFLLLPPIAIQPLTKIALSVEQADSD